MRRVKSWLWLLLMICGTLMAAPKAEAISITYEATNISGDTWQYTYAVSDYDFVEYTGFQILFGSQYSGVTEISSDADWDIFIFGPLPEGEYYSAQALADIFTSITSASFTVQFSWLGSGTPGAQTVELFSDNEDGTAFSITGSVDTVSTVPEPSTWALLALGLLGLAGVKHRGNAKA